MIDQGIVADDKEVSSIANVDIDIFSDGNYLDLEDKVEAIMIQNNFIRVGIPILTYIKHHLFFYYFFINI